MSNCTSIFISLKINEVGKLFHMIIGHWIPSFLKSLFKSISHFLLSSLFLIGVQAFLDILAIGPWSDLCMQISSSSL